MRIPFCRHMPYDSYGMSHKVIRAGTYYKIIFKYRAQRVYRFFFARPILYSQVNPSLSFNRLLTLDKFLLLHLHTYYIHLRVCALSTIYYIFTTDSEEPLNTERWDLSYIAHITSSAIYIMCTILLYYTTLLVVVSISPAHLQALSLSRLVAPRQTAE